MPGLKGINKMTDLFKNVFWYVTRERCYKKMLLAWCTFFITDHLKTQETYIKAVEGDPFQLRHVYDEFKTQEMCIKVVEQAPRMLRYVPDNLKSQEMCKKALEKKYRHPEICSQTL